MPLYKHHKTYSPHVHIQFPIMPSIITFGNRQPSRPWNPFTPCTFKRTPIPLKPRASSNASDTCAVGIDLGTTNSAIAVLENGRPVAIPNREGAFTTPSIVQYLPNGEVLVGDVAFRSAAIAPQRTFHSVKRFIGQPYDQVLEDAQRVAFTVGKDEDGFAVLVLPGDKKKSNDNYQEQDQIVYPEEISAHVLAKLLTSVEAHTGRTPTRAVISVPAYFNDTQREATMAAGRLAGLEKIKIIREPVAAALAYGLDVLKDETVLVFDLGGGTFDVSLLELGGGVIEVLSNGGDPHLGGDDWDASIVEWLVENYLKPARVDVAGSPAMKANLRAAAEAAKIGLSSREKVVIRMPVGNSGGIEAELNRQTFEGLTVELFRRARLPLDQACWQAGVDLGTAVGEFEEAQREIAKRGSGGSEGGGGRSKRKRNINGSKSSPAPQVQIRPKRRMPVAQVLLVGGATRMPAVQRFVKNMTGIDPKEFVVDPDLAVALGAAVQAGVYEGDLPDVMVMEVWQATLMRAFATQLEKRKAKEEGEAEGSKGDRDDDDEEEGEEEEEDEWDDEDGEEDEEEELEEGEQGLG